MSKNYGAFLHGPYDIRIENMPVPEINDKEVLIKVECVGICGSDVKMYTTGMCAYDVVTEPFVIGHEGAGVIVKVGSAVSGLRVGERVAIEPTQPCRACPLCRAGRYNLCPQPHYCSSLGAPGNLCAYYKHVADFCHKLVLIKVECVGICGSDVKMYTTGMCAYDVVTEPFVIGHEGAGVIVKVGSAVSGLRVGERVAIEPTQPCRACPLCRAGRYNLCPQPHYCSSLGAPGNLCAYYKHVADFCHKVPANLSLEEAAAVQPLAIALHACKRATLQLGHALLVLGAGPVGVLCAMTARAMGVTNILITDVVQSRLETAKSLGVKLTLNTKDLDEQQAVEQIQLLMGTRPDVSIDACAFPSATRVAMTVTKTGGVVTVVGIHAGPVEVPLSQALLREVDIRGSYRLLNNYPAALEAVSSGVIDLKSFISHHYTMDQTKEAIELAKTGEAMKIIIHVQKTNKL